MTEKTLPKYEVITMPLADLKEHPDNPRTIEDANLQGLAKSIEEFGLIEPIIWNKRTGRIVGGHQRKKALESAGYKEAQVLVVDFDEGKELMANISLNNPHIQGTYTENVGALIDQGAAENPGLAKDLLLDVLRDDFPFTDENEKAPPKPEVEFTQEIFEERNYVVLTFKNKADWVWLQSLYPLKTVKALDSEPGFEKQGVGRVVDGVDFLEAVLKNGGAK